MPDQRGQACAGDPGNDCAGARGQCSTRKRRSPFQLRRRRARLRSGAARAGTWAGGLARKGGSTGRKFRSAKRARQGCTNSRFDTCKGQAMNESRVTPVRVVLVDDHAVVREGYRRLLERTDDISVIAEVASAQEPYPTFSQIPPDIPAMNLNPPPSSD